MPAPTSLLFALSDPANWEPPITIERAREIGFTDFTFYPTAREAREASVFRALATGRKTIAFDERAKVGKETFVLHVMGETPRPKGGL